MSFDAKYLTQYSTIMSSKNISLRYVVIQEQ